MSDYTCRLLWPIVLIAAGVLMLLVQFNVIALSWGDLWRLWPVVLILAGISLLLGEARHGWIVLLLSAVLLIGGGALFLGRRSTSAVQLTRESLAYPGNGITEAQVRLEVGVGDLTVRTLDDTGNLLEAEIAYDDRRSTLEHGLEVEGGRAVVRIGTKDSGTSPLVGARAEQWVVRLNTGVPTHLVLNSGLGDSDVDLRTASLTRLELNAGVGSVDLSLPAGSYRADINGGVGALRLTLSEGAEARVHIDSGVGEVSVDRRFSRQGDSYYTAGYDTARERVEIEIDGGVGSIRVD